MPTNIRLGWKGVTVTNTPADTMTILKKILLKMTLLITSKNAILHMCPLFTVIRKVTYK